MTARGRIARRRLSRYLAGPATVRAAVAVMVWFTVVSVVLGGVVVWFFDRHDYPHVTDGLWWSLQTVTTVGYGDVVPTTPLGKAVGAVIMLESIAFLSVITAAITSSFVARRRQHQDDVTRRLDELAAKLDAIEEALRSGR